MPLPVHWPSMRWPDDIVHPMGERPISEASCLAWGTSTFGATFRAILHSISLIANDVCSLSKSKSLPTSTDDTGTDAVPRIFDGANPWRLITKSTNGNMSSMPS